MYKIGLFSKISKTTIKTLRYYDKEGPIKPEKIDRAKTTIGITQPINFLFCTGSSVCAKSVFQLGDPKYPGRPK